MKKIITTLSLTTSIILTICLTKKILHINKKKIKKYKKLLLLSNKKFCCKFGSLGDFFQI